MDWKEVPFDTICDLKYSSLLILVEFILLSSLLSLRVIKISYNVDEEFRKYCEKIQYDDKLITDDMFSNDDLCLEDPFSLNKNLDSWEEKHVNLNECSGQEDEEINGRI